MPTSITRSLIKAVDKAMVDYEGNCGNILQGVGPFAVDEGLVPASEPVTEVRIFNTNTKKIMVAEVPVRDGKAVTQGDFTLDGVPGTAARIVINFLDAVGSKTGKLLPTGNPADVMTLSNGRNIRVSLVDAGNPQVLLQASELGLTGCELPNQVKPEILTLMEEIRVKAAVMMGLAVSEDKASAAIPKVALVAAPRNYRTISGGSVAAHECDVVARTKALAVMHKAYTVTGGFCVGTLALVKGSVVHEIAGPRIAETGEVRVGHPSGVTPYLVSLTRRESGEYELLRCGMSGSARRIMEGHVLVPKSVWPSS